MPRFLSRTVIALSIAAAGCGDSPAGTDGGGGADFAGPIACGRSKGITTMPATDEQHPLVPGTTVMLAVDAGGAAGSATVHWTVSAGTLSSPTAAIGAAVGWTLPASLGVLHPSALSVSATITADGCLDDSLQLAAVADWPDALRTVVIHNPMQAGSTDVAMKYAAFRGIPASRLCAAPYPNLDVLDGKDLPAFADAIMACADAAGPQTSYLVPVWGVPYKVSGVVADTFQQKKPITTVSLDAVLAFGHKAKDQNSPVLSPFFLSNYDPQAGAYPDYRTWGDLRDAFNDDYFLVGRIDGADADAARALIDRTAAAEQLARAGKLAGTVYVDGNKGLPHPSEGAPGGYNWGEWEIIGVENVFKAYGKYPVVADYNSAEFGTAPAPLMCPDALYYAGWYQFGHYNDAFTWTTGAVGGHLDSCSACDIRGMTDWSAMALRKGITATFGAVNEPYVSGLPAYDLLFHLLLAGASLGEAGYESSPFAGWMMVWVGDPLYRPYASARHVMAQ
jgi:uncharacterized protein (TIGR03790 family)